MNEHFPVFSEVDARKNHYESRVTEFAALWMLMRPVRRRSEIGLSHAEAARTGY